MKFYTFLLCAFVVLAAAHAAAMWNKEGRLLDLLLELKEAKDRRLAESRSPNRLQDLLARDNHQCEGIPCQYHLQCCGTLACGYLENDGNWKDCGPGDTCFCGSSMG